MSDALCFLFHTETADGANVLRFTEPSREAQDQKANQALLGVINVIIGLISEKQAFSCTMLEFVKTHYLVIHGLSVRVSSSNLIARDFFATKRNFVIVGNYVIQVVTKLTATIQNSRAYANPNTKEGSDKIVCIGHCAQ